MNKRGRGRDKMRQIDRHIERDREIGWEREERKRESESYKYFRKKESEKEIDRASDK